jgi:MFS family permease
VIALGAPLLGGFIIDLLGWRWIFLVNVPLCALVVLLGWFAIRTRAAAVDDRPCRLLGRCCSRWRWAD